MRGFLCRSGWNRMGVNLGNSPDVTRMASLHELSVAPRPRIPQKRRLEGSEQKQQKSGFSSVKPCNPH